MKSYTVRLKEGQLFKEEIERIAREKPIHAGVILSVVGGLQIANLRMPKLPEQEKHIVKTLEGPFELVSGTGTISPDGCHIHIVISDKDGHCFGGHLKDGCTIKNTIELVIGILEDAVYTREPDAETGFDELQIKEV